MRQGIYLTMDISHINRIGKYLDKIEEWPCCQSTGKEDFETIPTRLSFDQIVADLPCLLPRGLGEQEYSYCYHDFQRLEQRLFKFLESNSRSPRQSRAIDAFQIIRRETLRNFKPHGPIIHEVRQFAACFDELLFEGKLLRRCTVHYWQDPPMTREGECEHSHYCPKHQQSHAVRILLERDTRKHNRSPKERLDTLLTLLLQKICHAWVSLFFDTRGMTVEDALRVVGHGGHGLAWAWVMRICHEAASRLFGFHVADHSYCEIDSENDSETEDKITALGERIAFTSGSPEFIHSMIQYGFEVGPDRASH